MGEIVRRQWRETTLPVLTIRQATEPTPGTDRGDEMPPTLKGHALGGIPETSMEGSTISGDPDTTDACTRPRLATGRALAADLIMHSRTLREMRDSEHQHDTLFLAAHVLSSSCANSGVVVQAAPTAAAHVPDARLRHIILHLRFGVPCVLPLDQWRCNCSAHAGPRHRAFVERVLEPNDGDQTAGTFAAEPLQGLYCRRRWIRVTKRHDYIRDALCQALERIPGVQATREPRVEKTHRTEEISDGETSGCTRTARCG